jgi:SAM-dependent methyltransferase
VTLLSGERQVAPTLRGIRGDHVARYRWAVEQLAGAPTAVLDAGCGIGYGAALLADAGHAVYAIDRDQEAIIYGTEHYDRPAIRWTIADVCAVTCHQAHVAVAFEILEHLERPGLALRRFPDRLLASVPNEAVIPKTEHSYPHHVRHYTPDAFELLLVGAGYQVLEWWTQLDLTDRPLARGTDGRTLVTVCAR